MRIFNILPCLVVWLLIGAGILGSCIKPKIDPGGQVYDSNQHGRIYWDYQGATDLNIAYILTVDSTEYILVRMGDGCSIIKHKDLRK